MQTTAILAPLRKAWPGAEIAVLGASWNREIFRSFNSISRLFIYNSSYYDRKQSGRSWASLWRELKEPLFYHPDIVIQLTPEPYCALFGILPLKRHIDIGTAWVIHHISPRYIKSELWVAKYGNCLRYLRIPCDEMQKNYPIAPLAQKKVEDFLSKEKPRDILIAVHPAAFWIPRAWPVAYFAETLNQLWDMYPDRLGVFIVNGPDAQEVRIGKETSDLLHFPHHLLGHSLSFQELAALYKACHIILCNDSISVHLADAVGTPVAAMYGPDTPKSWGPLIKASRAFYSPTECSPCPQTFCFHTGEHRCLARIKPAEVVDFLNHFIQQKINHQKL